MGNVKIRYFHHEVAGNQFCGRSETGLNPVTKDLSVPCCHFELDMEMNEKLDRYLNYVVLYEHFYQY